MAKPNFDDHLYLKLCMDENNELHLYDPETGRVLGSVFNIAAERDLDSTTATAKVNCSPQLIDQLIKEKG